MPLIRHAGRSGSIKLLTRFVRGRESINVAGRGNCCRESQELFFAFAVPVPLSALHKELMGHLTRAELDELSQLLEKARSKMLT